MFPGPTHNNSSSLSALHTKKNMEKSAVDVKAIKVVLLNVKLELEIMRKKFWTARDVHMPRSYREDPHMNML